MRCRVSRIEEGQLPQEAAWPHTTRAQLILLDGARYGECDAPADAGNVGNVEQEAETIK